MNIGRIETVQKDFTWTRVEKTLQYCIGMNFVDDHVEATRIFNQTAIVEYLNSFYLLFFSHVAFFYN